MRGKVYKRCPRQREDQPPCSSRCGHSWTYDVEVARGADGRRRHLSKGGFRTKAEAEEALGKALDRERLGGVAADHKLTVGDYLEQWLAGKATLRPTTARSYGEHVRLYLVPVLGGVRLAELRPVHVERLYAAMRALGATDAKGSEVRALLEARTPLQRLTMRPLSPATIRRVHATLLSALNTAVKRRLLPWNPAQHVELATGDRPRVRVWSPAQVGAFLDGISEDRLASLYHLVAYVGLRRGEAVGLRWQDVDLDAGELRVAQQVVQLGHATAVGAPKTDRGVRTVPLDQETVAVLRTHRAAQAADRLAWGPAWQDTGLVFTREDGAQLHPEVVTRTFCRLAKRLGLPPIRLHDLRHTSASLGLASGETLVEVSRRLGHSSITITADTYTHVLPAVASQSSERRAAIIPRTGRAQTA